MSQVMNTSMNFLPEDYVEKRQAARTAVICVGLLVVVVSGIVAAWWFKQEFVAKPVFQKEAEVNARYEQANKQIQEAQEIDREKSKMVQKAELTTLLMEKVKRSTLLAELTRLQPKGVNLLTLDLHTRELPQPQLTDAEKAKRVKQGLPPEPVKPPKLEVTMDITGTAVTDGQMTQYVRSLSKSPLLTDVNMLFSEEMKRGKGEDEETIRKFHVQMKINPSADMREMSGSDALTDVSSN